MTRWLVVTLGLLLLLAGGCSDEVGTPSPEGSPSERYRATNVLLVVAGSVPTDPFPALEQAQKAIESETFARDVEAASGVSDGRITVAACASKSGDLAVSVDAPNPADAKAASAKLATVVNDSLAREGPPGARVMLLHERPTIEKDPPDQPPC